MAPAGDFDKDYTAVMKSAGRPGRTRRLLRDAAERAADEPTRAAADSAAGRAGTGSPHTKSCGSSTTVASTPRRSTAAVGTDPGATTSIFNELDETLASAIGRNSDRFESTPGPPVAACPAWTSAWWSWPG